ncbi:hypothetical protein [Oceanimonas doudoroffii]|uniref:Uncharacterized protein n=1 Tax=Oceanimonas doudoroffii TaxID=84158 RepID=A0A233RBR0_9GAMM|nr:hypothetical protein [Oceanimonas doudoroffii]OXY80816.1 hypothetical protein B6S08_15420 [Oceanimonas doudoroffii]
MLATLCSLFPLSLRRQLAGSLVLAAMVMIAAGLLGLPLATHWAGLAYWCAAVLLWPGLATRNRTQALILLLVGGGSLAWSAGQGAEVNVQRLVAGNSGLLSMLVAVSFLSLVSRPQAEDDERSPRGRRALASTLAAVHLFGSVINLSSVFIIGDRLARRGSVTREQALVLIRGFTAAAFWSPFFAAMAVALSLAPEARLVTLWLVSMPLALLALLLTGWQLSRPNGNNAPVAAFTGYPLHAGGLALPGLLAAAVLALHELQPALSILAVITLMAPALTLTILTVKRQQPLAAVGGLTTGRLPQMGNELALFLAAGVLGYGLETLFSTLGGSLPLTHFGPVEASATYLATVALSLLGIHPIICISLAGAVLAPLEPNHTLLALVFLSSWAVGTPAGPLSGINLAFQGRYGMDSFRIMRWNLGYAAAMSVLVVAAIFVLAGLLGLA